MNDTVRDRLRKEGKALQREFKRQLLRGWGRESKRQLSGFGEELMHQVFGPTHKRDRGRRR
jgi:hypothetical protein